MDELISVMSDILSELIEINSKLDDLRGNGRYSIDDVCLKLDDIKGEGLYYNSLSDICDKLDSLETIIEFE